MSMNSLENLIVKALKRKLNNSRITKAWIQEWSTSHLREIPPDEECIEISEPGLHCFVALKQPKK